MQNILPPKPCDTMDGDGTLRNLLRIGPEAQADQAQPVTGDVRRRAFAVVKWPVLGVVMFVRCCIVVVSLLSFFVFVHVAKKDQGPEAEKREEAYNGGEKMRS